MNIKELQTLVTLAKTLNYPEASQKLNYAQSTLGHHIQVIEEELGVKIFEKQGRNLFITEAGKRFLPFAEDILASYDAGRHSVSALDQEKQLMIGGCEAIIGYCLRDLFSGFLGEHQKTRIGTICGPNSRTPTFVQSEAVDIGFYYSLVQNRFSNLTDITLFKEPICLIGSENLNIISRTNLHFKDLNDQNFVFPHDDCYAAVEMLRRLEQSDCRIGSIAYPGSMVLVVEKAVQEGALMALPYSAAKKLTADEPLQILDLAEEPSWMYARMIYKKEKKVSAQVKKLCEYSVSYAENLTSSDPVHFLKID